MPEVKLVRSGWPSASVSGKVVQREGRWLAEDLQLVSGTSVLRLDGVLATTADPTNELRLQLSRFDPALLQPEWPGAIDAELVWRGAWIEGEAVVSHSRLAPSVPESSRRDYTRNTHGLICRHSGE